MQVDTLLTQNIPHADLCGWNIEKNMWSMNRDGTQTRQYSSLEESYFWALTQSFTFSVLDCELF